MKTLNNRNVILDRDWMNWLLLLIGTLNLIVGIQKPNNNLISFINIFVSGWLFGIFLSSGVINRLLDLADRSIKQSRKLLEEVDKKQNGRAK